MGDPLASVEPTEGSVVRRAAEKAIDPNEESCGVY
jgi:hypothetical protein